LFYAELDGVDGVERSARAMLTLVCLCEGYQLPKALAFWRIPLGILSSQLSYFLHC